MDAKTAAKDIKQGKVSPLYLLYGSEKFRMNEFAAMLEEHLIAKEDRDFAVIPFDLSETPVQAVIEEAETVPFMVERKLLLVRDAALFTAGKEKAKLEHNVEMLSEYMQHPAEFSVIVFMVNGDKLDERKKSSKASRPPAPCWPSIPWVQRSCCAGWRKASANAAAPLRRGRRKR